MSQVMQDTVRNQASSGSVPRHRMVLSREEPDQWKEKDRGMETHVMSKPLQESVGFRSRWRQMRWGEEGSSWIQRKLEATRLAR